MRLPEYPFQGHFLPLPCGNRLHYLDEGPKTAAPILLLHGNPTWSFFYRHLVMALKDRFRLIAPDHLGLGLSDRPPSSPRLPTHIANLEHLLTHLNLPQFHLVVHDWGGLIGFGLAVRRPEQVKKIVILNTAAFEDPHIPRRIALGRLPLLGRPLVTRFFAPMAVSMAVTTPLSRSVKQGYLHPYPTPSQSKGVAAFVQDIPLKPSHPSFSTLKTIEKKLPLLKGPKLLLWGMKDFCFTPHFLHRWSEIYPDACLKKFPSAGHYLLEDAREESLREISHFFDPPPSQPPAPSPNMAWHLQNLAATNPHRVAIKAPPKKNLKKNPFVPITFEELFHHSQNIAHQLEKQHLPQESKVLLFLRPGPSFIATVFALFSRDLTPVLIDPGIKKKDLSVSLASLRPSGLIGAPPSLLILLLFPRILRSLRFLFLQTPFSWAMKNVQSLAMAPSTPPPPLPLKGKDIAAILFTSGATGPPKGAIYTHNMFQEQLKTLQKVFNLSAKDSDLSGFPLFSLFTVGMGVRSIIPPLNPAKPTAFDPGDLYHTLQTSKATFASGGLAIWDKLGTYCHHHNLHLPHLKSLALFGAEVPPELHEIFRSILLNGTTFTPYGATESLPVALTSGEALLKGPIKLMKQGKGTFLGPPIDGVHIQIIAPEDGPRFSIKPLPPEEIGEIIVHSPMTSGLYLNPVDTHITKMRDEKGSLWHRMGDLGYLDSHGHLWFCGRRSHAVSLPHTLLSSVQCEAIFNRHPHIKRSALITYTKGNNTHPGLVIERRDRKKLKGKKQQDFEKELLNLAQSTSFTREIQHFFYSSSLPVDRRHRAKIDRLLLGEMASQGRL